MHERGGVPQFDIYRSKYLPYRRSPDTWCGQKLQAILWETHLLPVLTFGQCYGQKLLVAEVKASSEN